jgi:hypothetical protein
MVLFEDILKNTLDRHVCRVVFTKANGTKRNMVCTRKINGNTPKNSTKVRNGHLSVFDIALNEWRSIPTDQTKLHSVEVIEN